MPRFLPRSRSAVRERYASRKSLPRTFAEAERLLFLEKFNALALTKGVVAILSFVPVDALFSPAMFWPFLWARLLCVPVVAVAYALFQHRGLRESPFYSAPALLTAVYLGGLFGFLTHHSGGESSIHVTGLLLAAITMVMDYPWSPRQLSVFYLLVTGPFAAVVAARGAAVDRAVLLADVIFFAAAAFLSITFYRRARSLRRADYHSRLKLEIKNRHQAQVIDAKTREGIYLERLASQFSPQVIDSIKAGTLDLEARVRRPVTCIFVDVQNSTTRANRIDHRNYTEVIAEFFDECVRIFLRHNVTVGTYLGDGILAFTNAPTEDDRFRQNALNACLEILAFHQRKRKAYRDAWRTEFNIRVGIESGFATVGFFPSRQHGTYTALGETVSLAARLCSRAEVNSIAVTKSFLTSLELKDSALEVFRLGTLSDIKGLEGEVFDVFGVRPPAAAAPGAEQCPCCAVQMERESTQLGAFILRCPDCGYRDLLLTPKTGAGGSEAA